MNYLTLKTIFRKDSLLLLLKIFLPTVVFLALVFTIGKINNITFGYFSRDAIQTLWHEPNAEVEFYIGFLSNIGIMFWCFTASILMISSKIIRDQGRPRNVYQFLFFSGLLTLFMLVDDLFLLHDVIIPYYLEISEKFFYLFYGSSVLAIMYLFRTEILKSDYILLLLAFAFMASSVITDVLLTLGLAISDIYLFEDGFKFMGIISWFVYFTRTAYINIRPRDIT